MGELDYTGKIDNHRQEEKKEKAASKIRFLCFIGAVVLLLAGCGIYMRLEPDHSYSSLERRMLAKRPNFTKKSVLRGKFQQKYETYLKEQFPGRTHMVTLRANVLRLLGERDVNGVFFGKDGYLLERYRIQDFDWAQVGDHVSQVAAFLKAYPNARAMFVPAKSSVLSQKLPMFAQTAGEGRFFGLVEQQIPEGQRISVADALKAHASEYIYYRTDHHWTTLGAYYAYGEWARQMGFSAVPQESFKVTDVTDAFLGTSYAKVRTGGRADSISLYEANDGQAYEVDYNRGEFQSDSFYDRTKLQGEDPYSVFFGGNQAIVDIRLASKDADGRTLLLVKDSFGNCFAPFVAAHYARTIVIDLRYVNIPVSKLMQAYPVDDILILYNTVQFMEDRDISKLQ